MISHLYRDVIDVNIYILYNYSLISENYFNKLIYINYLIITLTFLRVINIL